MALRLGRGYGRRGIEPPWDWGRRRREGVQCCGQTVRGLKSETPEQHDDKGLSHCYLHINSYMLIPGGRDLFSIHELPALLAQLTQILIWLASGQSIQIHCSSPLFPLHRISPFGLYFRLPDSSPSLNNRASVSRVQRVRKVRGAVVADEDATGLAFIVCVRGRIPFGGSSVRFGTIQKDQHRVQD